MELIEEYRRRRREHHHRNPTRRQLVDFIEFLIGVVEHLLGRLEHQHPQEGIIVQVQLTDSEKVTLHAVEVNAENQPVDKDAATCEWSSDRQDVVTLVPIEDGDGFSITAVPVGGQFGDTAVTATVTEPDVDNGDGTTTAGTVYTATQIVTVSQDEQIAAIDIEADAPVPQ